MSDAWLSEEQALLRDSALRYLQRSYPFDQRQALVSSDTGFSVEHWQQFADMGWLGAALPEAGGGLGGSLVDTAVMQEAFGSALVVEPYLSSIVLGAGAIAAGGGQLLSELLPDVVAGKRLLAFAHGEPASRYDLTTVETRAKRDGQDWLVSGKKSVVFGAASADQLVVSARTAGTSMEAEGITLAVVDRDANGVSLRDYPTVDGHRAADVTLDNVRVSPDRIVGETDHAAPIIESVTCHAAVAACAEAVGIMGTLVAATGDYLKNREQFGVPIARFQVLQHRVVDMFMAHQLCRSLTYRSALAIADDPSDNRAASVAKVQIGKSGRLIGQEAIQLHGGMGMTDELSVSHYFKRLTMIGKLFGDTDFHLRKLAADVSCQ